MSGFSNEDYLERYYYYQEYCNAKKEIEETPLTFEEGQDFNDSAIWRISP
jgi:hypothetical protein